MKRPNLTNQMACAGSSLLPKSCRASLRMQGLIHWAQLAWYLLFDIGQRLCDRLNARRLARMRCAKRSFYLCFAPTCRNTLQLQNLVGKLVWTLHCQEFRKTTFCANEFASVITAVKVWMASRCETQQTLTKVNWPQNGPTATQSILFG